MINNNEFAIIRFLKSNSLSVFLFLYAILSTFIIIYFDGTAGSGDSILHYLYARYAPQHPELFFNHWAKPLYVLLASPFAQFGIHGIKVFNALCTFLTIFFTYKAAKRSGIDNYALIPVFLIFAPLYFRLTFSGYTEPLFATFLSAGIFAFSDKKYNLSAIIISFSPFIRSEGLIIAGIFGLFFLFRKQYLSIILLLSGHLIYSFAGYFIYDDFLWVFTKIPYSNLGSPYGSGDLFHFAKHLISVTGVPLYVMLIVGLVAVIRQLILKKINDIILLSFTGFIAFLTAHSLFWYLGIFNSMGLMRVMIAVMPLIALIILNGYNTIDEIKNKPVGISIKTIIIAYILIFPFVKNPTSIDWKRDMSLSIEQKTATKSIDFLNKHHFETEFYVYNSPYISVLLNIDHFDEQKRVVLNAEKLTNIKQGDIIIWDSWFSVVEHGVSYEYIKNQKDLKKLSDFKEDDNGRLIRYTTFVKTD